MDDDKYDSLQIKIICTEFYLQYKRKMLGEKKFKKKKEKKELFELTELGTCDWVHVIKCIFFKTNVTGI